MSECTAATGQKLPLKLRDLYTATLTGNTMKWHSRTFNLQ